MSSALQQSNLGKIFAEYNGKTAAEVDIPDFFYQRHKSGITHLDELLGGSAEPGLRPCTNVMLSAVRGGGKTTLLVQLLSAFIDNGVNAAYISNEESIPEITIMCKRLGKVNIPLYNENDVDKIIAMVDEYKLDVIVIDSFNGLTTNKVDKKKSQYAIVQLMNRVADYKNGHPCSTIMCVHALADGSGAKAGGSDLSHCIHIVMQIDKVNTKKNPYSVDNVRIVYTDKNRTGELQRRAFEMTGTGYNLENPLEEPEDEPVEKTDGRSAEKNRRRETILAHLQTNPQVTMEEVINLCQTNEINAGNDLRALVSSKILVKIGRGKDSHWKKVVAE